jgi:TP901 family phage tail tape measure protein
MALTAGELVAYLKLDMMSYVAGLSKAKVYARDAGREIGADLRVRAPSLDLAPFVRSMHEMTAEAKQAASRIQTELRGINVPAINLPGNGFGGESRMRGQIQALISEVERLRHTAGLPFDLGRPDTARVRAGLNDVERMLAAMRASANNPIHLGNATGGRVSGGGVMSGISGSNIAQLAAYAGGVTLVGAAIKSTIALGIAFQDQLNTLQAVESATADQMAKVSAKAIELGNDISIPGASASDAAAAMLELAKGGLSVEQAMDAAKGTLQLAAAASIDGAKAADIQVNALNAFHLAASQAGHVADVLANTANAATGEATDFAYGMQQSAATANSFGVSLEDTSTVLGLFANAGIKGAEGGTILKSALLAMNKETPKSARTMSELGLTVWDQQGRFEGMRAVTDQLAAAKKRMTQQEYTSAAAIVFGSHGIQAANVLAAAGTKAYDDMGVAVDRTGGAAEVGGARMKGLGGALKIAQNAAENAQLTLFNKVAPALQAITLAAADAIPMISTGLGNAFAGTRSFFEPLITGAGDLISKAWPYIQSFGRDVGAIWDDIVAGVKPVTDAIGHLFTTLSNNGAVDIVMSGFVHLGDAAKTLFGLLQPVGELIGHVVDWFGSLPAPIQIAVGALLAMKIVQSPLTTLFTSIIGNIRSVITQMRIFTGTGMWANAGNLVRNFGRGLLAAFGGPIGAAITGVTLGLGFLFSAMSSGTSSAQQTKQDIDDITASLDAQTAAITDNTRATIVDQLSKDGTLDKLKAGGVVAADYVDQILGIAGATEKVTQEMHNGLQATIASGAAYKSLQPDLDAAGISAKDLAAAIQSGDPRAVTQKFVAYGNTLKTGGTGTQAFAAKQQELNQAFNDGVGGLEMYTDLQGTSAAKSKEVTDAQSELGLKLAAMNQETINHTDDVKEAQGGLSRAFDTTGKSMSGVGAAAAGALGPVNEFYTTVAGEKAGDPDTILTPMKASFNDFQDAVKAATDDVSLFQYAMDLLAGRDVSVEQAMSANAAAAREVGASYRQQVQDSLDLKKATEDVATAKANLNKKNEDGTAASDATTQDDITAALLKQADALDKVNGANDDNRAAGDKLQATAIARVKQVYDQTTATKGYAAGIAAATGEMKKQRQTAIDTYISAHTNADSTAKDIAKARSDAGAYANSLGLIPTKTEMVLLAKDDVAVAKVDALNKKAADAAQARTAEARTPTPLPRKQKAEDLDVKAAQRLPATGPGRCELTTAQARQQAQDLELVADSAARDRSGYITLRHRAGDAGHRRTWRSRRTTRRRPGPARRPVPADRSAATRPAAPSTVRGRRASTVSPPQHSLPASTSSPTRKSTRWAARPPSTRGGAA